MTRFHPKPALTALALILATTGSGWAQEGAPADDPVQQAPVQQEGDGFDLVGDADPDLDAVAADPAGADPDAPAMTADVAPADAPAMSADAAPADAPQIAADPAATPALPEGWTEHHHFGARFALPPGFTLEDLENEMRSGLLVGFRNVDLADHGAAFSLGFVPLDQVMEMPEGIRQEFGEDALHLAPEPVRIGPFAFSEYRGDNLVQGELNLSFRIYVGTEPMSTGLVPAVMMIYNTVDPADWADEEQQFRASIVYSDDPALLGMPDPETYRDGLFSLRLLPGWRASGGISPEFDWITLRENGMKVARIVLADVGTRDWSMESYLRDNYAGDLTIREGEFQGVPVWFLEGRAVRDLDANRTAEGAPWLRQGMITQLCVPERGPVAVELITLNSAREAGISPETVFGSLQLSLPGTATPCPAPVAEAIAAASGAAASGAAPVAEPSAEQAPAAVADGATAATLPEGWTWHERFGLRFGVPADFAWQEDMDEFDEQEGLMAGIGQVDQATHTGSMLALIFVRPETLDRDGGTVPEAMAAQMSDDFGFPISASGETREVLGQTFDVLSGHAEPRPGMGADAYMLVGRSAVNDWGFLPIIGLIHSNIAPADIEATNAAVLATLQLSESVPLGTPDPRTLSGLVHYQVPPGASWRGDPDDHEGRARFSGVPGTPDLAQLGLIVLDADPTSYRNDIAGLFREPPGQVGVMLDGVPAMSFEGPPTRSLLPGQRTQAGDGWIQRLVVTQMCAPGFGPIAVNAVTTEERIAAGFGFDWLIAPVGLTLPEGTAPCSDAVMAPFYALMPEAMTPPPVEPTIAPPVAEDLPMPGDNVPDMPAILDMPDAVPVDDGPVAQTPPPDVSDPGIKPARPVAVPATPTPTVDLDARAWAEAERTQSVDAMLAYVEGWPQGAHAAEARAWLAARAIMVPDPAPMHPAPVVPTPVQPDITHPQDMAAWQQAMRLGTTTALWDYLKAWPNGSFVQDAWIELDLRRSGRTVPAPVVVPAPPPQGGK